MSDILNNLDRISITSSDQDLTVEDIVSARGQEQILKDRFDAARANRFETDTTLRTHLTYIFSSIIFLWLASVILILWYNNNYLCLSDNVLITLLTTTSINVIGMMIIILKNLFPKNEK